jgi:hypothetical protein
MDVTGAGTPPAIRAGGKLWPRPSAREGWYNLHRLRGVSLEAMDPELLKRAHDLLLSAYLSREEMTLPDGL